MNYFGRVLNPPAWINDKVIAARGQIDTMKRKSGYPVKPIDPQHIHSE